MAEKQQHGFAFTELHWLNNPPVSSQALRTTTLMQNILSMTGNQDKGNPDLIAHENSSKPSPQLAKSYGGPPNEEGTRKGKESRTRFLSATFGIASATAVAPIERIHILMQCQNEMIKAGRLSTPYKGMKDCLVRTIKHEGFISLWRGNSMNVIRHCGIQVLPFAFVHLPNKFYMEKKLNELPLWMSSIAVMSSILYRYPLDYARVRLASDVKAAEGLKFSLDYSGQSLRSNVEKRQFSGVFDVYKKTLKLDGIHGLFRGNSMLCIGLLAYYMGVQGIKTAPGNELRNQKVPTKLALIVTGLIQYSLPPVVYYPFCTVSRRMMMTSGEATKYRGAMDALYQIVKNEGVSSLYKGLTPYLICHTAKSSALYGFIYMSVVVLKQKNSK